MLSCKTYEWLERSSYKCPYVTEEGPDAPLSLFRKGKHGRARFRRLRSCKEEDIMVPGAYFRDETIWRGRMIEFACDLKATLYELGFWAGVMYVAASLQLEGLPVAVGVGVCIKMLFGYRQEMRGGKRCPAQPQLTSPNDIVQVGSKGKG